MRDFIAKFNKLVNRIPGASKPTIENHKMFFISCMPPNIGFQIRHEHVANLSASSTLSIELEDDLIATRKWKTEIQSGASISFTTGTTSNIEAMLKKLSNKIISMKRQMGKLISSFQQPYQDIPQRQHEGKPL